MIYSFQSDTTVTFGPPPGNPVVDLTLSVEAGPNPAVAPITWTNELGMPPILNTVVVNAASLAVEFNDGGIELIEIVEIAFMRGDCNSDGQVNVADPIHSINRIFQGQPAVENCPASCDANGDDAFDASDIVYLLNYRFSGGPTPPAPFPSCGLDNGADCQEFSACP